MDIRSAYEAHAAHIGKDYGAGVVMSIEEALRQAAAALRSDESARFYVLTASYLVTSELHHDLLFAIFRWLEGTEDEVDDIEIVRGLCEATERVAESYREWLHTLVFEAEQFEFVEQVAP